MNLSIPWFDAEMIDGHDHYLINIFATKLQSTFELACKQIHLLFRVVFFLACDDGVTWLWVVGRVGEQHVGPSHRHFMFQQLYPLATIIRIVTWETWFSPGPSPQYDGCVIMSQLSLDFSFSSKSERYLSCSMLVGADFQLRPSSKILLIFHVLEVV